MANTRQTVSLIAARHFLDRIVYVTDVYDRGYQWSKRKFLPALKALARSSRAHDRVIAGSAYYVLGDVHDFNEAPLAAIRAYRCCTRLWPAAGPAWREIGGMYDRMGEYEKALRMLRKAVRVDPSDDNAVSDLEIFEEYPLSSPWYRLGDPYWQSSEFLAVSKHAQALGVLAGKRSQRADRFRARVYGAIEDGPRVLDSWRRVAKQSGRLRIDNADWFFLPVAIWNNPEFWTIFSGLASRIEDWGFLKGHEDLDAAGRERFELFLRYHLARTQHNLAAARKLSSRHPQWKEAARLVKRLGQ